MEGVPDSISLGRLGDRIRLSTRNPPGFQQRLPCPWLLKISMPLGVVTIQIGSTIAKMVDRPGQETLAILTRQALIHNP